MMVEIVAQILNLLQMDLQISFVMAYVMMKLTILPVIMMVVTVVL
jgi:hypothetical protein